MRRAAIIAALLVGCATGAIARDVILPVRAAGNAASYSYKRYNGNDLVGLGHKKDSKLSDFDAIDAALTDIGHAGWRLLQYDAQYNVYLFETSSGAEAVR